MVTVRRPSKATKPLAYSDKIGEDELNDLKDESFVSPNNDENIDSSNEVTEVIKFIKMVVLKPFYLELSKLVYAQNSFFPITYTMFLL